MKLSYIIPVYNVEKYIRQCLDSILAQTMDDYEIILVDDGSPDNCPAICDEYQEKYPDIVKVIHKENGGPAVARNVGIREAKGEYLFFADSDDYLVGDCIKKVVETAAENKTDILFNNYYYYDQKNDDFGVETLRLKEGVYTHCDMQTIILNATANKVIPYMWRNLYRREFLTANNIFMDENLKRIEDPPFNIMAFGLADKIVSVNCPIYCYRIREESLQRTKYVENYDIALEYQWKLKCKYYEEYYDTDKRFYEDLACYTVRSMLPVLLNNIFKSKIKERYHILKRIGNSEMMRQSFMDYDIREFKSKSLDWWMVWCMKYKLYPIAHLICDKILYK